MWQWRDNEGVWHLFKLAACAKAEEGYKTWRRGQPHACIITTAGTFRKQRAILDYDTMKQINVTTGRKRSIRRMVPGTDLAAPPASRRTIANADPASRPLAVGGDAASTPNTDSAATTAAAASVSALVSGSPSASAKGTASSGSLSRDKEGATDSESGSGTSGRPQYWSSNLRSGKTFVVLDNRSAEFRRVATMVRMSNRNKEVRT